MGKDFKTIKEVFKFKHLIKTRKLYLYLREVFYVLTLALLVFIGLELVKPRLVLAYINLNGLLLVWLFVGIVILIISTDTDNPT